MRYQSDDKFEAQRMRAEYETGKWSLEEFSDVILDTCEINRWLGPGGYLAEFSDGSEIRVNLIIKKFDIFTGDAECRAMVGRVLSTKKRRYNAL